MEFVETGSKRMLEMRVDELVADLGKEDRARRGMCNQWELENLENRGAGRKEQEMPPQKDPFIPAMGQLLPSEMAREMGTDVDTLVWAFENMVCVKYDIVTAYCYPHIPIDMVAPDKNLLTELSFVYDMQGTFTNQRQRLNTLSPEGYFGPVAKTPRNIEKVKEERVARSGPQYRLPDRTNWHHRVQICRTPLMRTKAQAPDQHLINKLDEMVKQEPALLGASVPLPHPDVFPKEKDLMTPF